MGKNGMLVAAALAFAAFVYFKRPTVAGATGAAPAASIRSATPPRPATPGQTVNTGATGTVQDITALGGLALAVPWGDIADTASDWFS